MNHEIKSESWITSDPPARLRSEVQQRAPGQVKDTDQAVDSARSSASVPKAEVVTGNPGAHVRASVCGNESASTGRASRHGHGDTRWPLYIALPFQLLLSLISWAVLGMLIWLVL